MAAQLRTEDIHAAPMNPSDKPPLLEIIWVYFLFQPVLVCSVCHNNIIDWLA